MSYLIEQHLIGLQAEGRSQDTITARRRCLLRLHADLPHGIAAACREQLTVWLAGPQEPGRQWSPATRRAYAEHIFGFYRWLVAVAGAIAEDPTVGMRLPRPVQRIPRPATDQQLAIALSAPEPLLTAVILANWAGMRRTEITNACREDITETLILIPVAKGGDPQTVPCHPVVWEHLREHPGGPLIADENGPWTRERLSLTALRWFRRNGLPGFGLHRFRHRYGTTIQEAQGDLRVTQECMRHKSINSTVGYTLVTGQRRRDAILRLPGIEHRPGANWPVPDTD